jgi:hypothetical protein
VGTVAVQANQLLHSWHLSLKQHCETNIIRTAIQEIRRLKTTLRLRLYTTRRRLLTAYGSMIRGFSDAGGVVSLAAFTMPSGLRLGCDPYLLANVFVNSAPRKKICPE